MKNKQNKYDKKFSYKLLRSHNKRDNNEKESSEHTSQKPTRKFLTMKENKYMSFKLKKMLGELPTIKKLKERLPNLYRKELLCIRCNKKEEDIKHIWECKETHNKIIELERINKEKIAELIYNSENLKQKDELIDKIYKYTRFKK